MKNLNRPLTHLWRSFAVFALIIIFLHRCVKAQMQFVGAFKDTCCWKCKKIYKGKSLHLNRCRALNHSLEEIMQRKIWKCSVSYFQRRDSNIMLCVYVNVLCALCLPAVPTVQCARMEPSGLRDDWTVLYCTPCTTQRPLNVFLNYWLRSWNWVTICSLSVAVRSVSAIENWRHEYWLTEVVSLPRSVGYYHLNC